VNTISLSRGMVEVDILEIVLARAAHGTHHRGQAHAMLSGTSVEPPQLDEFFSEGEAPLRAGEFAALGFSEEAIWGPPS
jgi:uncharacterized damage-inducible protein DinB